MTQLTDVERDIFEALTSGDYNNFCLIRAQFRGKDVSVICLSSITEEELHDETTSGEDDVILTPLFFSIDTELLEEITPATEEPHSTVQ